MKPHKHCELIKAWADGAEIQMKCDDGEWKDVSQPNWYASWEYRIKQRTLIKEGWVNIYRQSSTVVCCVHPTEKEAKQMASVEVIATVKVEWEEEE